MREIKLRAWDVERKGMYLVMSFTRIEQTPFCLVRISPDSASIARETIFLNVIQYAGVKDKNGKEIYEGDIVTDGELIGQVFWHDYMGYSDVIGHLAWHVGNPDRMSYSDPLGSNGHYHASRGVWEIIGNIYENPELLEEKEDDNNER